jgi:threonine dehydrogenase-like Zn-dependent dehydrogenase
VFGRAVRVAEIISHRLPVARATEAFALAMRPSPGTLKVILEGQGAA